MASFYIHLAVGKRYLEQHQKNPTDEFYQGIVAPDLATDKDASHYTLPRMDDSLLTHLQTKVSLYDYLKDHPITSDYEEGVFLHLITDYLFFNTFFDQNYLASISYPQFCSDLYYSYDLTNEALLKYYQFPIAFLEQQMNQNVKKDSKKVQNSLEPHLILKQTFLDDFIERVASLSLMEYRNQILKEGNCLPK